MKGSIMQINQLKCFIMAAKYESITKAAKQMYISQPSLTSSISLLEKELGVALFERTGRRIKLSPVGKRILINAQMVVDECNLITHICDLQQSPSSTVTFTAPTLPKHISFIAHEFMKAHRDIRLLQVSSLDPSPEITIDATVDENWSDMRKHVLTEEIGLVVPSGHELAGMDVIDLKDLAAYPVVSPPLGTSTRTIEDHFCKLAGFAPIRERENSTMSDALETAYAESGIVFFPFKSWGLETISDNRIVRLRNPRCYRHIYVEQTVSPSSNQTSMQLFSDFVVQFFADD
ncbi:MAG: LysR family transcriptional regulator [Oscillospiraceae bacterium]|nr:LysR family transcriptional regulator [Oscillospiraceae bacterium]